MENVADLTAMQVLLMILDMRLTNARFTDALHTAFTHKIDFDKFMFGELYYLSDGGYSRLFWDFDNKALCLTSNSSDRAKEKWIGSMDMINYFNRFMIERISSMLKGNKDDNSSI